jgi:8-oxo-dGTP pyrophosphatase MutT (NUDIX family)
MTRLEEVILRASETGLPGQKAQQLMAPEFRGTGIQGAETKQSAVISVLFASGTKLSTLLIKRTVDTGPHSGQIALPGGRAEKTDRNIMETATRECCEEIGICRNFDIGPFPLSRIYIPASNSMVHPFFAYIGHRPITKPNIEEVAEIIEIEIDNILPEKSEVKLFETVHGKIKAPAISLGENLLWGATAMILAELCVLLTKSGYRK